MPREQVVLLDAEGRAIGVADKATVHHAQTPLHLAFSCYAFDAEGRLLTTQRSLRKASFPGVWTNSLCGHPGPGEPLEDAVRRRGRAELDIELEEVRLILPEFSYRAEMNGLVENELCPVVVARAIGQPRPSPDEVEDTAWEPWAEFAAGVLANARELSPWCGSQVRLLVELGPDSDRWPTADARRLPPALLDLDPDLDPAP